LDQPTLEFYNKNASEIAKRYNSVESPLHSLLPLFFKQNQRILDVGCGSGRDVAMMLNMGFDAFGIEPCAGLREQAAKHFPELKGRIFPGSLPQLSSNLPGPFDHIVMSAVIMHIPDNLLLESALKLRSILNPGGLLVISHCPKRDVGLLDNREDNGRLFILRNSAQLQLLFEELGFQKRHLFSNNDKMDRSGVEWETLVMEYEGSVQSESVDRIDSIINQDRKTASYKLALLRALCDLAQLDAHRAQWTTQGQVKVSIDDISQKWMEYYLPLMGHDTFVPNNRGETITARQPLAFRKDLTELSRLYPSNPQGLAQFIEDRDRNRFSEEAAIIYQRALGKIRTAIKNGPVVYSSGNSFEYDKTDKTVVMDGALWREMVLLGHWIEDSLKLKWAQLIHEFSLSTREFSVLQALELLMMTPDFERRVGPAKIVYKSQSDLTCLWSGKRLTEKTLAIDHAIPFSLRHDNSLWNLVPAHKKVNLEKSDKLPTSRLIQKRKDGLIYNWQILYAQQKELFNTAACRFLGMKKLPVKSWETDLFRCFYETIEVTASRRGVERWEI
jgi:SAM-dependent methyltransferase